MAKKVYNGSTWEDVLTASASLASASISLSTTYQAAPAVTAPNTSNKSTGLFFHINTLPTVGNIQVEVRESGVSKVNVVLNLADLRLGWNWGYFTTPYQFTTTSAGAYIPYVKNTVGSSGAISRDGSVVQPSLNMTYDTNTTLGTSDNAWVMGKQNAGMTAATWNNRGSETYS